MAFDDVISEFRIIKSRSNGFQYRCSMIAHGLIVDVAKGGKDESVVTVASLNGRQLSKYRDRVERLLAPLGIIQDRTDSGFTLCGMRVVFREVVSGSNSQESA